MIPVSCGQIADAVGGELAGIDPAAVVTGAVAKDSREVVAGGLFVALPGERVDGHDYVPAVTEAGATVSLTTRPVDGCPCIVVADTQVALGELARYVVAQLPELTVIGLTGSQGKTSTKDLIAQLVAPYGPTVAPTGSFNNEIGHPLTALQADRDTRYLVAEMGARHLGDIAYLCRITPPKVGLVLNVGYSHIGEFGSRDAIAQAKGEMIANVAPGGTAVLNADDPRVAAMASRTEQTIRTFGEAPEADVRATDLEVDGEGRPGFTLHADGQSFPVQLQLIGEHNVSNALAAATAALAVGLTPEQVADGLNAAARVSQARMEVVERPDGVTVINDAYNANPDSVRAALKALVAIGRAREARTWAVLGEMLELGDSSATEHDAVGRLAVRLDVNRLLAVGEGAKPIHLGASLEGSWGNESAYVATIAEALELLRGELRSGDVVLVKSSKAANLRSLADALLETAPAGEGAAQ
ncbi:UDP-N-acetylmuramoylalanyl-D-glutamyl-2,6-diaminopimelate/ D-alanyl-D-alanylligase [Kribbella flavida DSM 17836]|uniref:UDP-N-acetylmuramoyl-tripeptide--D-alanyl-D-alanine ligase n=1 Tax=Kribbella flavida (strain DSM 17836 / JCM 10339 / NBRC 14399) TaxID=479435 RepID=D2Q0F6_KRIFD|nr:UDP-N-acetylmuramoyl-tripeptide--D-alanyl-D-alanine ligase [Kribbella flavida]ADB31948.1 UDP-N-acetylmuramoylalanyl-D-glutamyl-2,6-diaminopimelate/ D-alanyl-D-alanylligase [Kribbella flavida DSM 17836]